MSLRLNALLLFSPSHKKRVALRVLKGCGTNFCNSIPMPHSPNYALGSVLPARITYNKITGGYISTSVQDSKLVGQIPC